MPCAYILPATQTLFTSHWASALKLIGKVERPVQRGAFVVSRLTQIDSVQIMNWRFMHFLLSGIDWKGQTFKRVDMLIRQRQIYDIPRSFQKAHLAHVATRESLQTM